MKKALSTLMLSALVFAQTDRQAPDDLADQKKQAQAERDDKLGIVKGAARIVSLALVPDTDKDGALTLLQMLKCVTEGDFARTDARIYRASAEGAGRLAEELEEKARNLAEPNSGSGLSAVELEQQVEEVEKRIGELSSKEITPVERVELEGVKALRQQLIDAIRIVRDAGATMGDSTTADAQAREMRSKEALFKIKAEQATTQIKAADAVCLALRTKLNKLAELGDVQRKICKWDLLGDRLSPCPDLTSPSGVRGDTRDIEKLRKENEEWRAKWSSPAELQKRENELQNLAVPPTSN